MSPCFIKNKKGFAVLTAPRADQLNKHTPPKQSSNDTAHISITEFCSASEPGKALTKCLLQAIHAVPSDKIPQDLRLFNPRFPVSVHEDLLELLEVFVQEVTSHNLTHFMAGGTLIGSWRHHGFIPWDDDIDVFMHVEDKPLLKVSLYINSYIGK